MLAPTPENFRAEMSRHRLRREDVAGLIGMHPNFFSMIVNGVRPLQAWSAHNIGWAINKTTGLQVFNVEMRYGPVPAPRGRPKTVVLEKRPARMRRRYWRRHLTRRAEPVAPARF